MIIDLDLPSGIASALVLLPFLLDHLLQFEYCVLVKGVVRLTVWPLVLAPDLEN